jgi:hypothetical protein
MEFTGKEKAMANQRSPNCPQITFEEAAEKGRMVYDREHTHPAAREVVASSLGYSGINGRSLSMIGALRQYGIIEGSGEALRISDDAVAYFELEDGDEKQEALLRMMFHPPFFAQIRTDFGASLPSESNLKHYLIKNGFLPKAAEDVIKVYQENIRLVGNTPKRYTENQQSGAELMGASSAALAVSKGVESLPGSPAFWSQSYSFPLSRGTKAELTIKGEISKESLARLKAHIELTIQALSDDFEPET